MTLVLTSGTKVEQSFTLRYTLHETVLSTQHVATAQVLLVLCK
jgi:hypothetical protein